MGSECMQYESIWFDRNVFDEAEELNQMYVNGLPLPVQDGHHHHHDKHHGKQHHDHHDKQHHGKHQDHHHGKHQDHHHGKQHHDHHKQHHGKGSSTSVMEIAEARRKIQQTLSGAPSGASSHSVNEKRLDQLEADNKELRQQNKELVEALKKLELRVAQLESSKNTTPAPAPAKAPAPPKEAKKEVKKEEKEVDDDESDDDLFGSDSEDDDAEQEKIKQERLAAYYAKKATKPKVIAKSSITVDVKPWDDETDVKEMEKLVRSISADGLVWGASKILPIAYGIKKLQIACVVEDDKIGTDFLEEHIGAFEDHVQSVDVVSFNKL